MNPSVFDYSDAVSYLNALYEAKKRVHPRLSLRVWAKQIGIKDGPTLWRILKGRRVLGQVLARRVSEKLRFTEREKSYFELLVYLKKLPGHQNIYLRAVRASILKKQSVSILQDQFQMASEWHHYAILELSALKDFRQSPKWIADRLGNRITPQKAREAIARLVRLKFLRVTPSGDLRRASETVVFESPVPSKAVRRFHQQMIRLALRSIHEQDMSERLIRGSTIALRRADFDRAKEIIVEAHNRITELSVLSGGDDVLHFSSQFFKLSQKRGLLP